MSFVDMDVEATTAAVDGLAAAGTGFDGAWSGARSAVEGAAAGLGLGPMGQAFLTGYRPAAQQLTDAAANVSRGIGQAVEAGRSSTAHYQAADANAAAGLGR
ncbi:hypothetical protein LZ318_12900 [Saccharopolyspora indica]|uniref:hypothetical protein n=1 Tax=Saccharopolyspora indica TaxID=1229659 RepID=UPI0022EA4016|nr:hypothetical protein [Saccharopolyspora indica]MDA3647207.1 hypothetical protein [Saccharopolyspora indica]